MRRARRVDAPHRDIVAMLRAAGVFVVDMSGVGDGVPDLLCGVRGVWKFVEIKDGKKKPSAQALTQGQAGFHAICAARGLPCVVARSGPEALHLLLGNAVRVSGAAS